MNTKQDQETRLRSREQSAWKSNGTLTSRVSSFGGTDPSFNNVVVDKYNYKELSDTDLRVVGQFETTGGGVSGTSSYQISLPAGYEFDSDIVEFETRNGIGNDGRGGLGVVSGIGTVFFTANIGASNGSTAIGMIVPTSATTFRLAGLYNRAIDIDSSGFWGQIWYDPSISIAITFDGILPVKKI